MKIASVCLAAVATMIIVGGAIIYIAKLNQDVTYPIIACPADAKLCPDGSGVGRVGPNCEFAPCPPVTRATTTPPSPEPTFCTEDARICPNGSGVGRDGTRNCTFYPCPGEGRVSGTAHAGPTCPVLREGDTNCGDKPFTSELVLTSSKKEAIYVTPNKQGKWFATLPAGHYTISTKTSMPSCRGEFSITAGMETAVDVSCDTGIR